MRKNQGAYRLLVGAWLVGTWFSGASAFAEDGAAVASEVTAAQPELSKAPLVITSRDGRRSQFSVEVARRARELEVGEMFRTSIPPDGGMLFLWPRPFEAEMWMRHTLVPLDILFVGADHRIQAIAENAVPLSEAHITGRGPAAATIELAGGTTEKLGIEVGDAVSSPAMTGGMRSSE